MMDPYDDVRRMMRDLTDRFTMRDEIAGMRRLVEDAMPKPAQVAEIRKLAEEATSGLARQMEVFHSTFEADIRRVARDVQGNMDAVAAVTRNLRYRW